MVDELVEFEFVIVFSEVKDLNFGRCCVLLKLIVKIGGIFYLLVKIEIEFCFVFCILWL